MKMSNTDQGKPAGKSGRRNRKGERGKKAAPQQSSTENPTVSPAPVELQSPDRDHQPEPVHAESAKVDQPAVQAVAASPELQPAPSPVESTPAEVASIEPAPAESVPVQPAPVESAAEPAPVSLQTIANAYRDYTRKSLEEFGSFVEQLSSVRSLDKAMTVQSEFVKRAYENSVAESQRICELHSKLAKQTFQPFQGFVGKAPETRGKS